MSKNPNYKTAFAEALDEQLRAKGLSQAELARRTGRSPSYLNHTLAGRKPVSPEWANVIAQALACSKDQRKRLHYAAATDAGYELDLTQSPFRSKS